ncbi:MAG TPA: hypothetical protein VHN98_09385 [Acidimicrobiales bacterium]|nr:hypothetical protein [Acidimicrobiales bacterium]
MTLTDAETRPLDGPSQEGRRSRRGLLLSAAAVLVAVGMIVAVVAMRGGGRSKVTTKLANTLDTAPPDTTSTTAASTSTTAAVTKPAAAAPAQQGGPCSMPTPGSSYPDARFGAALAATPTGFVLYGGKGGDFADRTDAYRVECNGWAKAAITHTPPALDGDSPVAVAYDPAIGQAVLVGGGATWAWNGSDWTSKGSAPQLSSAQLVYDAAHAQLVLVGNGDTMETWTWDGAAWTKRAANAPSGRSSFALVYDAARARTYLFGGASEGGGSVPTDLWSWDGTSWAKASPAHTPPSGPMTAAFDAAHNVTIALAFAPNGAAETWQWDGTDWTKLSTAHTPPRRLFGSMAFIPVVQRVVLFGGKVNTVTQQPGQIPTGDEQIVNDLWVWSGTDWTQLR